MWNFDDKWSRRREICMECGMVNEYCMCKEKIAITSEVEFWLLIHPEELKRTSNTGRLINTAILSTRIFTWNRVNPPKDLMEAIESNNYNIYLVMAADRENEKTRLTSYTPSDKKPVFLILDGTWKEVRKMLRKSPYLDRLPILSFDPIKESKYDLRRNTDDNHLCTVEVAIAILHLVKEYDNAKVLNDYFDTFLKRFHKSLCQYLSN